MEKGLLVILSGPSGAGKGTVVKQLVTNERFALSTSMTTRAPRAGEVDGRDYFFANVKEFEDMIVNDQLLEYAQYVGNYYGTPRQYVTEQINAGKVVLLEIEIEGALQVKAKFPDAVLIFLVPPNMQELKRRLEERNTETDEVIAHRLSRAQEEMAQSYKYDHVVINDTVTLAVARIQEVVGSYRA